MPDRASRCCHRPFRCLGATEESRTRKKCRTRRPPNPHQRNDPTRFERLIRSVRPIEPVVYRSACTCTTIDAAESCPPTVNPASSAASFNSAIDQIRSTRSPGRGSSQSGSTSSPDRRTNSGSPGIQIICIVPSSEIPSAQFPDASSAQEVIEKSSYTRTPSGSRRSASVWNRSRMILGSRIRASVFPSTRIASNGPVGSTRHPSADAKSPSTKVAFPSVASSKSERCRDTRSTPVTA